MVSAERSRQLLAKHGVVQSRPADDWTGDVTLPPDIETFFQDVGPVDITIQSYGNPYFLPRLSRLWQFQAGYRWNGLTGETIADWDPNWLVVADEGGDAFIYSVSGRSVLFAVHGAGRWEPEPLFADLNTMGACLAHLGTVRVEAGKDFTDKDSRIRLEHLGHARDELYQLLGSMSETDAVLGILGWM
jgi:hypothetical protein